MEMLTEETLNASRQQCEETKLPELGEFLPTFANDLGDGDVSRYGATAFETPNIDRLAAEGQRFTSEYCSASNCTPTRFSFLTGNYAFRYPGSRSAEPTALRREVKSGIVR